MCEDCIVSIHQPHVWPIVRGKAKAKVEFVAKIGVSIVRGYSFIDHHSWDAYNEATYLTIQYRITRNDSAPSRRDSSVTESISTGTTGKSSRKKDSK